jgi:serine/threonine-protein phosphatase PPG1
VTEVYGFYGECMRKYGTANVWRYFTDMFDHLPLSASVENRIYCVHGGLSPSLTSIDHIRFLNRFKEVPMEGPMTDLLWSDPTTDDGGFVTNPQGAGFLFGSDAVDKFTTTNGLDMIMRSHQLCLDGYQNLFGGKLLTTWSAPNFCHRAANAACIVEIQENLSVYYNTYLAAPESERIIPTPDVIKPVPDYFE